MLEGRGFEVVRAVTSDDLYRGHQVGWLVLGSGNALFNWTARKADFVEIWDVGDLRVVAKGSQHVHVPSLDIFSKHRFERGRHNGLSVLLTHSDTKRLPIHR